MPTYNSCWFLIGFWLLYPKIILIFPHFWSTVLKFSRLTVNEPQLFSGYLTPLNFLDNHEQLYPRVLTPITEWLYYAFFPQEDHDQFTRLRSSLSPFLKGVSKALSNELEDFGVMRFGDDDKTESIINEIVDNIPDENSTSSFVLPSMQNSDTVCLEFNRLLNIRYGNC